MTIANDGLVYVCNRQGDRIQVYDKMGTFKKNIEVPWRPYTADGKRRESGGAAGKTLSSFGGGAGPLPASVKKKARPR